MTCIHRVFTTAKTRFVRPRGALAILLALALSLALIPGLAFADGSDVADARAVKASSVPASDISADLVGKVVSISPTSDSKRNLDVKDSSRTAGAPIVAAKKKPGTGQRFEILSAGAGLYVLRSAHTGRLITEKDGAIVQTGMTAASDDTQRWAITKRSGGYIITNASTENRLSVSGSATKPATAATAATAAQIFKLKEDPILLDGYHSFITEAGNVAALKKDSIEDDDAIILKKNEKNARGRQFFLISSPNGYHAVKNSISFKTLSVKGSSKKDNTPIVQSTYKKGKNQRFRLVPSGDGWYYLKSALGSYLSASSDKAKGKLVTTGDGAMALKVRIASAKYSTGTPKLDSALNKIRKKIGTKGDVLKKSFNYVITSYPHINHENNFKGDWIPRYAWHMISKKQGQCQDYAAMVCVLFRSYGYDARVVTGYIQSRSLGWVVHGWVEATIGGKTYVFDPSLAHRRGIKGWYKRTYKNALVEYRIEKRW